MCVNDSWQVPESVNAGPRRAKSATDWLSGLGLRELATGEHDDERDMISTSLEPFFLVAFLLA